MLLPETHPCPTGQLVTVHASQLPLCVPPLKVPAAQSPQLESVDALPGVKYWPPAHVEYDQATQALASTAPFQVLPVHTAHEESVLALPAAYP